MSYDDAVAALAALGLTNVTRQDDASDEAVGTVLYTDPAAGQTVPLTQRIVIHVSKGPDEPTQEPTEDGDGDGDGGNGG